MARSKLSSIGSYLGESGNLEYVQTKTTLDINSNIAETFKTDVNGDVKKTFIQQSFANDGSLTGTSFGTDLTPFEALKLDDLGSDIWNVANTQTSENADALSFGSNLGSELFSNTNTSRGKNQNSTIDNGQLSSGAPLVYPETRDPQMDYLKITPLKYTPGGFTPGAISTPGAASKSTTPIGKQVFLPMQPALQDSNSPSWGDDSLNAIQTAGAGIAMNAIGTIGEGDPVGAFKNMIKDTGDTLNKFVNAPGTGDFVKAYFAGQAVGANVLGRETGAVLNNNLELLFKGPTLRSFNYNYKFTPRSASEAAIIKEIILQFKKVMAVKRDNVGLFLKSPDVFNLEYIFGSTGEQHPFMNKIKTCALTNMTVDYTPDGTYMTYGDGSMTSYNVSLQFSELEPIYRSDQDEDGGMGF